MKKTDDISRWVSAPINGKDVVWSFIVDSLKAEHDDDAADAPLRVLGAFCFVNFYYTDINE